MILALKSASIHQNEGEYSPERGRVFTGTRASIHRNEDISLCDSNNRLYKISSKRYEGRSRVHSPLTLAYKPKIIYTHLPNNPRLVQMKNLHEIHYHRKRTERNMRILLKLSLIYFKQQLLTRFSFVLNCACLLIISLSRMSD